MIAVDASQFRTGTASLVARLVEGGDLAERERSSAEEEKDISTEARKGGKGMEGIPVTAPLVDRGSGSGRRTRGAETPPLPDPPPRQGFEPR